MSKVILLDGGVFTHRAIFNWNMSQQRKLQSKTDMLVMPSHYTYFLLMISALKKIGVSKGDKVILCLEGHSWRTEQKQNLLIGHITTRKLEKSTMQ